jgi:DNA polymerase-3 subunit epsilon
VSAFVAIDFETANHSPDSACAVGLVRAASGRIVAQESFLIRPPTPRFAFTWVHGLTWAHVREAPAFADLWPRIADFVRGAAFLAAHNAPFDRGVLAACCRAAGLRPPPQPFVCTVRLARTVWGIRPTRLPDVCRHLGLDLTHHDALSDARACAGIVLAAEAEGWRRMGPAGGGFSARSLGSGAPPAEGREG